MVVLVFLMGILVGMCIGALAYQWGERSARTDKRLKLTEMPIIVENIAILFEEMGQRDSRLQ